MENAWINVQLDSFNFTHLKTTLNKPNAFLAHQFVKVVLPSQIIAQAVPLDTSLEPTCNSFFTSMIVFLTGKYKIFSKFLIRIQIQICTNQAHASPNVLYYIFSKTKQLRDVKDVPKIAKNALTHKNV